MKTAEGNKVNFDSPLSEHPNPQFERKNFLSLNGKWDFELNSNLTTPTIYTKTIIVPFSVETPLSWIEKPVNPHDVMHYRKIFSLPASFEGKRIFLHFEGVDQVCDVKLNDKLICHHEDGYDPFVIELTDLKQKNILQVDVVDDTSSPFYARGKQMLSHGGIWYTPTSGIWQSVWIEATPKERIKDIQFMDDFDNKICGISIDFEGKFSYGNVKLFSNGKVYKTIELDENLYAKINLFGDFHPWTPEDPYLYYVEINVNDDIVYSYFAVRKISVGMYNGFRFVFLNNKPTFLSGILDQGYNPDGGLTYPTDKAMIDDIELAKSCGFNFLRKHIKIENKRWYYHCDRLGMLVMQDMMNFGTKYSQFLIYTAPFFPYVFHDTKQKRQTLFGAGLKQTRENYLKLAESTIKSLKNHPCIFGWTIFNEGWGQFKSIKVYNKLKLLDVTRLYDVNSGWYDQGVGDFNTKHIYFKKNIKMSNDNNRILGLSEFGGYGFIVPGHTFIKSSFGYKNFRSKEKLEKALLNVYKNQITKNVKKSGLALTVYTQLTDVEEEINGLVTYDRHVVKIDRELLARLNKNLEINQ